MNNASSTTISFMPANITRRMMHGLSANSDLDPSVEGYRRGLEEPKVYKESRAAKKLRLAYEECERLNKEWAEQQAAGG